MTVDYYEHQHVCEILLIFQPEPRQIVINPFDHSAFGSIEKAMLAPISVSHQ